MKSVDVCGLGNAIVDIPIVLSEEEFRKFDLPKGSELLSGPLEQQQLLAQVERIGAKFPGSAGGSVANSVYTVAQLSGHPAFCGRVADDEHGVLYRDDFQRVNIQFGNPFVLGGRTGTAIVFITPDGERTMRANLGVSRDFSSSDVDWRTIRMSRWLFIEGHLFGNGPAAQEAVFEAIDKARDCTAGRRTAVALTLSSSDLVHAYRDEILRAVADADLVFANQGEAVALTSARSVVDAFRFLTGKVANVVVTAGADGAYVKYGGVEVHVPADNVEPIDTTGAGDVFAGGFLYGIAHGYGVEDAARGAGRLASRVIVQYGARLTSGVREAWAEGE